MPVAPTRERLWRALRQRGVMTFDDCTASDEPSDAAPVGAQVVAQLGDPDGGNTPALADRGPAHPGDFVSLADPAAIGAAVA
jgi:hypothetical protein